MLLRLRPMERRGERERRSWRARCGIRPLSLILNSGDVPSAL